MTDETGNLILGYMRRFSNQLSDFDKKLDRFSDDVHDLKVRKTNVEEGLAGINRWLDRLDLRMDRVERRLEPAVVH